MKPLRFTRLIAIAFALLIANPVFAQNADAIFDLISKGDLKQAQKRLDAAQKDNETSADLLLAKALIADKKGESEKAVRLYLEIIETYPAMIAPYNNLAIHYAKEGDYKSAIATLEKALSLDQAIATTYGNLQSIFARMASLAYRKALNSETPTPPLQLAAIESAPETLVNGSQPTLVASAENFIEKTLNAPQGEATSTTKASPQSDSANIVVAAATQTGANAEVSATVSQVATQPDTSTSEPTAVEPVKVTVAVAKPVNTSNEVVAPVKPSEEDKLLAEQSAAEKQALINHVKSWANAWSERDVDRYLSHYSNGFKPRDNLSLEEWKKQRYGRLRWREFIIVKPSRYSIDLDNDLATVNFNQYYKSERFEDTIRKTLKLRKENGKWRITREFI